MARVRREVRIDAEDMKKGMTVAEIRLLTANLPDDMVPRVIIGLSGRIRAIRFEMEFDSGK